MFFFKDLIRVSIDAGGAPYEVMSVEVAQENSRISFSNKRDKIRQRVMREDWNVYMRHLKRELLRETNSENLHKAVKIGSKIQRVIGLQISTNISLFISRIGTDAIEIANMKVTIPFDACFSKKDNVIRFSQCLNFLPRVPI